MYLPKQTFLLHIHIQYLIKKDNIFQPFIIVWCHCTLLLLNTYVYVFTRSHLFSSVDNNLYEIQSIDHYPNNQIIHKL